MVVGIFIGFIHLFSVDVYKKIVSKNKMSLFHEGVIETETMGTRVKESKTVLVEKELELIDEPQIQESPPVRALLHDEVDFAESSLAIRESDIPVKKVPDRLLVDSILNKLRQRLHEYCVPRSVFSNAMPS
ncbi:hypothetical protein ZEAMMB73_Zm00001d044915 [Zea mays]|uniref:Uncharacterized protein n=1 Tax=Zea mays TaxID=4577 RepID=A0A1D6NS85_MAIZE|nr:hypothetical protein ZEAMMB73_Zm00001d044915 [Zea mays]